MLGPTTSTPKLINKMFLLSIHIVVFISGATSMFGVILSKTLACLPKMPWLVLSAFKLHFDVVKFVLNQYNVTSFLTTGYSLRENL